MRPTLLLALIASAACGQIPICTLPGGHTFLHGYGGPGSWAAARRLAPGTWEIRDCSSVLAVLNGVENPRSFHDLDGDGRIDLLVRINNSDLAAVSAGTGVQFWSNTWADGTIIEDVTGDGVPDILMPALTGPVAAVNGATGGLAGLLGFPAVNTCGDFDGDGTIDWVTIDQVRSGADTSVLFDASPATLQGLGDVDGDGLTDVLVRTVTSPASCGDMATIHYGPDGLATSSTIVDFNLEAVTPLDDLDGDGRSDWVAVDGSCAVTNYYIGSGDISGNRLSVPPALSATPAKVHVLDDIDGDGLRDFALGYPIDFPGLESRVYGSTFHPSAASRMESCPPGPLAPNLWGPSLAWGVMPFAQLTNVIPGGTAAIVVGIVAPTPPITVGNCQILLDPASTFTLTSGPVSANGSFVWSASPLPVGNQTLLGIAIDVQAGALSPMGTLQIANALRFVIGSSPAAWTF